MEEKNYICACCGGEFEKAWSDEEAMAESKECFPSAHARQEPMEIVCDDCFKKMTGA